MEKETKQKMRIMEKRNKTRKNRRQNKKKKVKGMMTIKRQG